MPHTADIPDRLRALGYGHMEAQFPLWQLWLADGLAGEGLHTLLERAILPAPADPAPANFCMLGWYSKPRWPARAQPRPTGIAAGDAQYLLNTTCPQMKHRGTEMRRQGDKQTQRHSRIYCLAAFRLYCAEC